MSTLLLAALIACKSPSSDLVRRSPVDTEPTGTSSSTTSTTPPSTTTTSTDPTDPTTPVTTPVDEEPLPPPPFLSVATVQDLSDTIDAILDGQRRGVRVVDAENGEVVYEWDPDAPLTPASNTKLYTTAAAMDELGEDHRHRVAAYGSAAPDALGRVTSLTVLSEHDSAWSDYVYADEYFVADRLADLLYDAGVRQVTGTLTLAGEVLVDGYSLGTFDEVYHRGAGVDVLELALEDRGITVAATSTSSSFATPAGVLLAERYGPALSVIAHPLNVYSHNEMADILADHNGYELWGESSYEAGNEVVLDFLDGLAIDTTDVWFADGSGLSHSNTTTARATTDLLLEMQLRPAGQAWERTFAIGGTSGTLASRLTGADTIGRVYAKTGSLWNVIALSGVLYNTYDGHRYVFSILQDDVADQTVARALADDVVEALADDLRGGDRPDAPVLQTVLNPGDGTLEVTWEPSPGAAGYGVWVSDDGLVWDRADAVVELGDSHVLRGLPVGAPAYVRVTAFTSTAESEPSDVYAATPSQDPSTVLVVDGNDRWSEQGDQWENTRGANHDFVRSTVESISGRTVDSVSNEAVIAGLVDLDAYDVVIWTLGEESSDDLTFDADERALVADFLDNGGALLASGAEIGWDLVELGSADATAFFEDDLHAVYVGDDGGTFSVLPEPGGLFDGMPELGFYTPGRMVVDYPDELAPGPGADAELAYVDGGTAAISYDGAHQVVLFGFPLESIDGLDHRAELMDRVLDFFGV